MNKIEEINLKLNDILKTRLICDWNNRCISNCCCLKDSAGVLHLKRLSSAGISHIHLLPTFQFAEVDDQKENWRFIGKFMTDYPLNKPLFHHLNLLPSLHTSWILPPWMCYIWAFILAKTGNIFIFESFSGNMIKNILKEISHNI